MCLYWWADLLSVSVTTLLWNMSPQVHGQNLVRRRGRKLAHPIRCCMPVWSTRGLQYIWWIQGDVPSLLWYLTYGTYFLLKLEWFHPFWFFVRSGVLWGLEICLQGSIVKGTTLSYLCPELVFLFLWYLFLVLLDFYLFYNGFLFIVVCHPDGEDDQLINQLINS